MVMTFEQTKELEELKQTHKKEILGIQAMSEDHIHEQKMERLERILEIAKAGPVDLREGS